MTFALDADLHKQAGRGSVCLKRRVHNAKMGDPMNSASTRIESLSAKFAWLLGTTSLLIAGNSITDQNGAAAAEAERTEAIPEGIPENVLITGSLIRGTVAVGVPVIGLSAQDFAQTGVLTTADLFRTIPQF